LLVADSPLLASVSCQLLLTFALACVILCAAAAGVGRAAGASLRPLSSNNLLTWKQTHMRRDRVAEDIYTFTSDLYAKVTAGVILTPEGTIVIDTLPFPSETREMLAFVEQQGTGTVRYVINTHYHSDHTNGTFLFPDADVIAHRRCRETLIESGEQRLAEARKQTPGLGEVTVRVPNITFERDMYVHLGERSLFLTPLPGHTGDCIGVFIDGDKILFAGDAMLPVPHVAWGDIETSVRSLQTIRALKPDTVIQGHGQLLLRGELAIEIESSLKYLNCIKEKVQQLLHKGASEADVLGIDIEACGKSRVPLDGLVQQLHRHNLLALYDRFVGEQEPREERVV